MFSSPLAYFICGFFLSLYLCFSLSGKAVVSQYFCCSEAVNCDLCADTHQNCSCPEQIPGEGRDTGQSAGAPSVSHLSSVLSKGM